VWEGVGAQRKRPHKPNHSGGLHAAPTPAELMRLSAGMSTRRSVLGQRHGITHALKLVAKCKAWCGCMSCTDEMKTRTAPAQLVQPLACWPERLGGTRCLRIDTAAAVLPAAHAEWLQEHREASRAECSPAAKTAAAMARP
jgi:hypothetical protein